MNLEVTEVDKYIRIINEAREQGKLAIFVGAGVSANSGLPSWNKLVKEFANALGIIKDEFTQDELIKIPQYYYNDKSQKIDYYQVIENKFNKSYLPNPIHKLIFKFKPCIIITTNFDNLLEQMNDEYDRIYKVIKKDDDLSKAGITGNIIKMHGDFELKNFILKEDDFLSYSQIFPLIENYIKTIFSSSTILFVGYGADDPDVKLIFQWVKDLLGEDNNRAYLLYVNDNEKTPENIFVDYFKNRGIDIISYNDLDESILKEIGEKYKNDINEFSDDRGKKLYKILIYILWKQKKLPMSSIDYIYEKIHSYKKVNYILHSQIKDILGIDSSGHYKNHDVLEFIHIPEIYNFITEINTKIDIKIMDDNTIDKNYDFINKIKEIGLFFKKIGIRKIISSIKENNIYTNNEFDFSKILENDSKQEYKLFDDIILFDLKNIKNEMETDQCYFLKDNIDKTLLKAFILYLLKDYEKAYNLLILLSKDIDKKNTTVLYYIIQFNISILLRYLSDWRINLDEKKRNQYEELLNKIDLETLYFNLSDNEKNILAYLKDINNFSYFYKEYYKLSQINEKIDEEISNKMQSEKGYSYNIYDLINKISDFWNFNVKNYLMTDTFSENKSYYKSAIKSLLKSHNMRNEKTKEDAFGLLSNPEIVSLKKLNYFIIFLMIRYLTETEIKDLINTVEITEIELINEEGSKEKEYLLTAFENIIYYELNINWTERYLGKILQIMSLIKLNDKEFKEVYTKIVSIIKKNKFNPLYYRYFNRFIFRQIDYFKNCINSDLIIDGINVLLEKVIKLKFDLLDGSEVNIINNLLYLLKKLDKTKIIDEKTINNILSFEGKRNYIFYEIIINLYNICDEESKNNIKKYIKKWLQENFNYELYLKACLSKVIDTTEEYEKEFFNSIKGIINNKNNKNKFPSPIEGAYIDATNYIAGCNVINKKLFEDLKNGGFYVFDVFYDVESMDFKLDNIREIMKISTRSLIILEDYPDVKLKVRNVMEEFIKKNPGDKEMTKKYIDIFINNYEILEQ